MLHYKRWNIYVTDRPWFLMGVCSDDPVAKSEKDKVNFIDVDIQNFTLNRQACFKT